VRTPATLVVVKPSTGELLAVADANSAQDLGLSAQQPPGSLIGLASALTMLRNGYTLNSRLNCSSPWTYDGQVFRNSQGPGIDKVTLGAAVEGGCTTGIAGEYSHIQAADLRTALFDLGLVTPSPGVTSDAPDVDFVGDQLGTAAFYGVAPTDTDPLHHVENLVGEGKVLVSPLALARATATVATGVRQSVRLVVDPPARAADLTKPLSTTEAASLQDIMLKAVTEPGGSANALSRVGGDLPHAMAGTAGYGTGSTATRTAWCTGYRGDYAFTVLITNAPTGQGASGAVTAAGNFLKLAG